MVRFDFMTFSYAHLKEVQETLALVSGKKSFCVHYRNGNDGLSEAISVPDDKMAQTFECLLQFQREQKIAHPFETSALFKDETDGSL